MTTATQTRKGGLDWTVPQTGIASDAYEVARTASLLWARAWRDRLTAAPWAARHATRLHVISGKLWKLATAEANGYRDATLRHAALRRQDSLERDVLEITEHYGLACSFGGLVNGGLVIGTPEQLNRVDPERHGHVIRRLGR